MSLFSVTRYLGEDDELLHDPKDRLPASEILDRLRAKAEARKLKSRNSSDNQAGKRKSRSLNLVSPSDDTDPSSEKKKLKLTNSEKSTKSERKKKKYEHEENDTKLTDSSFVEIETEQTISPKKKKSLCPDKNKRNLTETSPTIESSQKYKVKKFDDLPETESENGDSEGIEVVDEEVEAEGGRLQEGSHQLGGFTVLGDFKAKRVGKVHRVLPDWLSSPDVIVTDLRYQQLPVEEMTGLDADLRQKLVANNITYFFPVQIQVIPALLDQSPMGYSIGKAGYRPRDVCVSAPTGSGKTLAFVLPIVQALKSRVVPQVRALAILPVRDLATQVYKVFKTYCQGTGLKVGLLIGQKTFHSEQQSLVKRRLRGYQSMVDIIVATPGRLVDHINRTEGFDLQYLRFLVIDEADRMMEEIKQDWLLQVESAIYKTPSAQSLHRSKPGCLTVASAGKMQVPLQKLLFSATLSQNPEKLQQLNLFQPRLFTSLVKESKKSTVTKGTDQSDVMNQTDHAPDETQEDKVLSAMEGEFVGKYTTPAGLTEYFVECEASAKPLMVLHFLHNLKFRQILCFTNSVETTHRLFLLLKLFGEIKVREFSSSLHAVKRNRILQQFASGKTDIIICSDAMARGMDFENVKYVISYDPPSFIKTYIHRIGRTARAGKAGTAVTLLQKKEFYHFKKMVREAGKSGVKELKISKSSMKPLVPSFQKTLAELPDILQAEKRKRKSNG